MDVRIRVVQGTLRAPLIQHDRRIWGIVEAETSRFEADYRLARVDDGQGTHHRGGVGQVSEKPSDARTIEAAAEVLDRRSDKGVIARILPFLGPAFIASVAYMDPGNFATNIQAGAKFGYALLWVVVASNLMAMVIQALSAKLGIATGRNLAEHCRSRFPRPVVLVMWALMEVVAMATDLAEFLGAAIGFHLLLGMPLWMAGVLTALTTLA
ncbi:MAG: Nramp family divalent metal transporter, partial [Gemmatimonadales bacterium]